MLLNDVIYEKLRGARQDQPGTAIDENENQSDQEKLAAGPDQVAKIAVYVRRSEWFAGPVVEAVAHSPIVTEIEWRFLVGLRGSAKGIHDIQSPIYRHPKPRAGS